MNLASAKLDDDLHLTAADRALLASRARRVERIGPRLDLIKEGDDPLYVNLVLEGWACRYKQLEDGRRQIISFFLPGDLCDPCVFLMREMSHAIGTLTPATIARIPRGEISALMQENSRLNRVLWFDLLINTERQREWTVSLGRRSASERLAHLFCELMLRMRAIGLVDGTEFDMPITQADLGDALGLSTVHVNRTLQDLRAMKLVDLKGRRLLIHNEAALQTIALFNPDYLHLSPKTL